MNIVAAVRCYNEEKNITRFLRGYDFCDHIVISDGGSTDYSVDIIKYHQKYNPKIHLIHFTEQETVNGQTWNPDAPHMNFVLDAAKEMKPDWLFFDDMDCVPNRQLREHARTLCEIPYPHYSQMNAFRLYMWGDKRHFSYLNRNFDSNYVSLWAWRPDELDIRADPSLRHGTLMGLHSSPLVLDPPYCLLHKSWNRETIKAKMKRYNALGLPMHHPYTFAGRPKRLPGWAVE